MKHIFLTLFLIILFFNTQSSSQTPDWQWAKSAGGTLQEIGKSIAVDKNGNSYIIGTFSSTTITLGTITLTNFASGIQIFIAKYDINGNVVWAKGSMGYGDDQGIDITVDANGYIYITGYFYSPTIQFGTTTLTHGIGISVFIVKYDSNGNVIWAKNSLGDGSAWGSSISVDKSGNSYVTGIFGNKIISFDSETLINNDTTGLTYDVFIAKYDSNGNFVWAKNAGGNKDDYGNGIAADGDGNSYVTGFFESSTIKFNLETLTNDSSGARDIFIVKFNTDGNVLWAKRGGGMSEDYGCDIAIDLNNNCYVTGYYASNSITFDSTTLTTNNGQWNMFIMKYDSTGNVKWINYVDYANSNINNSIAVDTIGNVFLTGELDIFTTIFGAISLTNTNNRNIIFVAKYNSNGSMKWVKYVQTNQSNYLSGIAVDTKGNNFVIGYFYGKTITFDGITVENKNFEDYDLVIFKLGSSGKFRTFSASTQQSINAISSKGVKLKIKSGILSELPNEGTVLEKVFLSGVPKAGATLLGIPTTDKIKAKTQSWLLFKKASSVQAFYTALHTGSSYPIDSVRKAGKKSKVLSKAITPTRKSYNNPLWAQGVLLRLNILACDNGVTPSGFGELVLDTSFTLIGQELEGMTLRSIADYLDSLMSLYAQFDIGGANADSEYNNLGNFANLLSILNSGFYETMSLDNYLIDSVLVKTGKKPYAVTLSGVKTPDEVGIVAKNPNWKQAQTNFITSSDENPDEFSLLQNYPNPFNPQTTLSFGISNSSLVTLKVYDVLGQEVATLLDNELMEEGAHELQFDASYLSSGVYFYRLNANGENGVSFVKSMKMVLMK